MKQMRNKFEERFAKTLGPEFEYEPIKLSYTLSCNYQPDFVDVHNKTIFETKGFWRSQDRRKLKAVKAQHPDWRLIMVLQDPNKKISKASKTTYGEWCDKNGIEWIPFK